MTITCERCSNPLGPWGARFCSLACYLDSVRVQPRACLTCHVVYQPLRNRQRYCAKACVPAPPPRAAQMTTGRIALEILRANQRWWMTTGDLSIWTYGSDDDADQAAVRRSLTRLRQRGYVIESRPAPWARQSSGPVRAYRLVSAEQRAEMAA